MSKFDFDMFYDDRIWRRYFCISKERYTEEEADAIFVRETECDLEKCKKSNGYVYHGFGAVDDEVQNGLWLSDVPKGRYPIEVYVYEVQWNEPD